MPKMAGPINVLLVEDRDDDAQLLMRELRKGGFEPFFERVETEAALRQALARRRWDVVISDYSMPAFDAPGALKALTESGFDLPFIVVSGAIGEDRAVS